MGVVKSNTRWSWQVKLLVACLLALFANGLIFFREEVKRGGPWLARLKTMERRLNPLMVQLASSSTSGPASLEHTGRRSGRTYVTPLAVFPVPDAFLIGMPYGRDADWVQNLLSAGEGIVQRKGIRYRVANPRILPAAQALPRLPRGPQFFSHLVGIPTFLELDAQPLAGSQA
jgi:deazaflavin-dependent oxidoreductase (nitroreductase family)